MEVRRRVHIAGSKEGIRRAAEDFGIFSSANHLPARAVWPFQVALDEMLSNIVDHGYRGPDPAPQIDVEFRLRDGVLEVAIADDAPAFDPLAVEDPDTTRPVEQRPLGGLGIFLVRKLMDSVAYERRDGRNRLVCRKRVDA
jgi:anti-sigma regulatory factor (Ser/Thr protein kinase)